MLLNYCMYMFTTTMAIKEHIMKYTKIQTEDF